jgi:hypothetical protein
MVLSVALVARSYNVFHPAPCTNQPLVSRNVSAGRIDEYISDCNLILFYNSPPIEHPKRYFSEVNSYYSGSSRMNSEGLKEKYSVPSTQVSWES